MNSESEINLAIGDRIGIGDECVGVIDAIENGKVHITSEIFTGWATQAELIAGILAEQLAESG